MSLADSISDVGSKATRRWLSFDPVLAITTLILIVFGLMSVLSVEKSLFTKQALLLGIGFVPFMIAFTIPPAIWQRLSWLLYMINVGMLLLVMFMGNSKGGAQRWIDIGPIGFQPSEMSKFLTVLTVTTFFVHRGDDLRSFSTLLLSLLHVIPVVLLIAIQPHYAAAASVLVGWIAVAVVVRVNWKHMAILFVAMSVLLGGYSAVSGKSLLRGYHMDRIGALFTGIKTGKKDTQGQDFQVNRGLISIGIGGTSGQGYLQGEFKGAAFVPEQENDLIFSVIGQEWGFAGSIFLLTLYLVFFLRGWQLCLKMEDLWSRSVCLALLAVMAFHWTVNMAMNLGIGPVIGLWLPFISYGGTALWVCLMMVGLILNLNSIQSEEQFSRGAPKAWMR